MYYFTLIALGAIILFVGWPRTQSDAGLYSEVQQHLDQLSRNMIALENRLRSIETALATHDLGRSNEEPLSSSGLSCYQSVQQDWKRGSSLTEICLRYQLLQGEVILILDLMKEGMETDESWNICSIHSDGGEQESTGDEGGQPC